MRRRQYDHTRRIGLVAVTLFAAVAVASIEAGGWIVITVSDVPDYVVVGQPVMLTYGVRQHGRHLLDGLAGRLEARLNGDVVRSAATPTSEPGHYSSTLTLPHAGEWTVDILSGFGGGLHASRIVLATVDAGQPAPVLTEEERGQRLYVAKGCVTCHSHGAVQARSTFAGATLTTTRYQPEYLASFLAHPPSREPYVAGEWQMPDLKLRDREIASLVAFLNSNTVTASRR